MEYTCRGGVTCVRQRISPREISKTVADMDMGPWISSIIEDAMHGADLADNDFMGKKNDTVSISQIAEVMAYYAATTGYSATWESTSSSVFDDFRRRPGVYDTLTRKIENLSTQSGNKKLTGVKKCIRMMVNDKAKEMFARPNPLGAFVDAADMYTIYHEIDDRNMIISLHNLGKCPQEDPRFYVHMIYRYYLNDFHRQMADQGKVLRFPSILKIMDLTHPIDCTLTIPSEFRMFVKSARGNKVAAVTLPVPSKSTANEVVYGYDFESAVPWVPVMRSRIHDFFTDMSANKDGHNFSDIYPKYLVKGEHGNKHGNNAVVEALARSIEIDNLIQTLDGLERMSPHVKELFDKILAMDARVANVYMRYSEHHFHAEGEQLPERVGFFAQESVRGLFQEIAASMSSFCDDMYTGLNMKYDTVDLFVEYCTTKNFMTFKKRGEELWRDFVINMQKICCVLYAWYRKPEVDRFTRQYVTTDGYLRSELTGLEDGF